MRCLMTILFAFFMAIIAYAQPADKVLARVKYNFSHVRDTNSRNNPYTEIMILMIGKNASAYTSLDRLERELDLPKAQKTPQVSQELVVKKQLLILSIRTGSLGLHLAYHFKADRINLTDYLV